MANKVRINIIGRLGKDPELRTVRDQEVCSMRIAADARVGGEKKTEWFSVSVWGKQAQSAMEFLRKGSHVDVEGRFHTREWENRDGKVQTSLEINADQVTFLDPPPKSRSEEKDELFD